MKKLWQRTKKSNGFRSVYEADSGMAVRIVMTFQIAVSFFVRLWLCGKMVFPNTEVTDNRALLFIKSCRGWFQKISMYEIVEFVRLL